MTSAAATSPLPAARSSKNAIRGRRPHGRLNVTVNPSSRNMLSKERLPAAVLICHQSDRLDSIGLASWLATTMRLTGVVEIRGDRSRLWRVIKRQYSKEGLLGFADVLALRAYSRLRHHRAEAHWAEEEVGRL